MAKKSRDKGARYERKIAKILSVVFNDKIRRVPLSGGLDIKCDLYNPEDDTFPYFIECKHGYNFKFDTLMQYNSRNPISILLRILINTETKLHESYMINKYRKTPIPIVIFRGGDFKQDMVALNLKYREQVFGISLNDLLISVLISVPFTTDTGDLYRAAIVTLNDFLAYCDKRYLDGKTDIDSKVN
jgi:hypothetical protein